MTYHPLTPLGNGLAGRLAPGPGDGVLWIHGYALDSSCWGELWERLPDHSHVGVDLPGHGSSLPLDPGHEPLTTARRLADLAEARGLRHVVALSLGTLVALQMASERPEAFASLVLGSPLVAHGPHDDPFWRRYRELVNMYMMGGFGEHLRGRLMLAEPSPFETAGEQPELWQRLWQTVGRHPFWDLRDGSVLRIGDAPLDDVRLHGIQAAVLTVVGEKEAAASKRHAERLDSVLPDCRRLDLFGAGRLSLLEAPIPSAAAIDAHLRAHAASPGRAPAGPEVPPGGKP